MNKGREVQKRITVWQNFAIAKCKTVWEKQARPHKILLIIILALVCIRLILLAGNQFAATRVASITALLTQVEELNRQLLLVPSPASMEIDRLDGSVDAHNAQLQTIKNNIDSMELSTSINHFHSPTLLFYLPNKPSLEDSPQKTYKDVGSALETAQLITDRHLAIMLTLEPFFEYDAAQDLSMIETDTKEAEARIKNASDGLQAIKHSLETKKQGNDRSLQDVIIVLNKLSSEIMQVDSAKKLSKFAHTYNEYQKEIRSNRTEYWRSARAEALTKLQIVTTQLLQIKYLWEYAEEIIP